MRILVAVERTDSGSSAFSPDLQGCAATGGSRNEVERAIRAAISEGISPPEPRIYAPVVEVAA